MSAFYGIDKILFRHARLPNILPFPLAVQHGWSRYPSTFESSANPPEIWVWSERIAHEFRKLYDPRRIRIVGAPFCYLYQQMRSELPPTECKGSIVIPTHSSHFAKSHYSVSEYVEMLSDLPDRFRPITVMLYYLDMTHEVVDTYTGRGYNVVCNGSLWDSDFLVRFTRNVYGKQYCIFNELGSGVFYSAYLGLKPFYYGPAVKFENRGNVFITEDLVARSRKFDEEFIQNLSIAKLVSELGVDNMIGHAEMRKIILRHITPKLVLDKAFLSVKKVARKVMPKRWYDFVKDIVRVKSQIKGNFPGR
jgi:hypothetical protein